MGMIDDMIDGKRAKIALEKDRLGIRELEQRITELELEVKALRAEKSRHE